MPLVLTTNEVVLNPDHAWDDIEGVQYHYPNQYKNKIKPGEPFVYYRGVHRKGGRRGQAEYFGSGVIGEVRMDTATAQQSRPSWFCAIEDYKPFKVPIAAKKVSGQFYESIASNMWRNGVRDLSPQTYQDILTAAAPIALGGVEISTPAAPTESDTLIVPKGKVIGDGARGGGGWRKSKQSKVVGDWAEAAAIAFVQEKFGAVELFHRAKLGERPGWDFDFKDHAGVLHRVEVKGTVAGKFISFDLTERELASAKLYREGYWIFLIARCLTGQPLIQRVQDPAKLIEEGSWVPKPAIYNISFKEAL